MANKTRGFQPYWVVILLLVFVSSCSNVNSPTKLAHSWVDSLDPVSRYQLHRKHTVTIPQKAGVYVSIGHSELSASTQKANREFSSHLAAAFSNRLAGVELAKNQEGVDRAFLSASAFDSHFMVYPRVTFAGSTQQSKTKCIKKQGCSPAAETSANYVLVAVSLYDAVQKRQVDHITVKVAQGWFNFNSTSKELAEISDLIASRLIAY